MGLEREDPSLSWSRVGSTVVKRRTYLWRVFRFLFACTKSQNERCLTLPIQCQDTLPIVSRRTIRDLFLQSGVSTGEEVVGEILHPSTSERQESKPGIGVKTGSSPSGRVVVESCLGTLSFLPSSLVLTRQVEDGYGKELETDTDENLKYHD